MPIRLFAAILAFTCLSAAAPARAEAPQQIVERANITVKNVLAEENFDTARELMKNAKGVLVARLFKAGFIIGGEGGNAVLLAKTDSGEWSPPAFYTIGAGSVGLQIGIKDAEVLFIIRTAKGVDAILDNQVKLGADIAVTAGPIGAGMSASTTTNLDADIVSFSLARGAFGGGSLDGAVIAKRTDYNREYYGGEFTPRAITAGRTANPDADGLRRTLSRY